MLIDSYLRNKKYIPFEKAIRENKIVKTENQAFVEFKYLENQLYGILIDNFKGGQALLLKTKCVES